MNLDGFMTRLAEHASDSWTGAPGAMPRRWDGADPLTAVYLKQENMPDRLIIEDNPEMYGDLIKIRLPMPARWQMVAWLRLSDEDAEAIASSPDTLDRMRDALGFGGPEDLIYGD